jgi:hypothetical protein
MRATVFVFALSSLTACESARECIPGGSTRTALDVLLLVGVLVCTGVTAAGSDYEDAATETPPQVPAKADRASR